MQAEKYILNLRFQFILFLCAFIFFSCNKKPTVKQNTYQDGMYDANYCGNMTLESSYIDLNLGLVLLRDTIDTCQYLKIDHEKMIVELDGSKFVIDYGIDLNNPPDTISAFAYIGSYKYYDKLYLIPKEKKLFHYSGFYNGSTSYRHDTAMLIKQ
jgi:hypothetical protein